MCKQRNSDARNAKIRTQYKRKVCRLDDGFYALLMAPHYSFRNTIRYEIQQKTIIYEEYETTEVVEQEANEMNVCELWFR